MFGGLLGMQRAICAWSKFFRSFAQNRKVKMHLHRVLIWSHTSNLKYQPQNPMDHRCAVWASPNWFPSTSNRPGYQSRRRPTDRSRRILHTLRPGGKWDIVEPVARADSTSWSGISEVEVSKKPKNICPHPFHFVLPYLFWIHVAQGLRPNFRDPSGTFPVKTCDN